MKRRWYTLILAMLTYLITRTEQEIRKEQQLMNAVPDDFSAQYMEHWRRQVDYKIQLERMRIKRTKYEGRLKCLDN